jgi:RNA polymerase sigma-70 factor (ECF subfamily)
MSDEELMAAVVLGDPSAYQALVRKNLPAISRYALRLVGSRSESEDIAQETFLRLWTTAKKWDPAKAKLTTWLHRITHNLCIDFLRKQKRVSLEPDFDSEVSSEEATSGKFSNALRESAEAQGDSPDREAREAELRALDRALNMLPEAQRSALLLCNYQGFSNKEAADIMGSSVQALESLIARAKRGLRTQLEDFRHD